MDIQIESTPPKRIQQNYLLTTPPKRKQLTGTCETPVKNSQKTIELQATPQMKTPNKNDNPLSTKLNANNRKIQKTPGSSSRKITEFFISRLEQDYIFEKILGEGNFSSVGLYRSRMTNDLFAIKTTKLSSMSVNEAQALGTLSIFGQKSKNIVRYYHSWVENFELFLVMEHCNRNLANLYKKHHHGMFKIQQSVIKDILKQALMGLKCMHQNKIVHLDVKPDNILFKDSILKISDLGLARITKVRREGDLDEGDSRYIAKEMLNFVQGMDLTKADIFSLGLTIYEGVSLEKLPNNGQEWIALRQNGLNLQDRMDLQDYSPDLFYILEQMTHPNPSRRPSAVQILKTKYFKDSLTRKNRLLLQNSPLAEKQADRKKQGSI